MITFIGLLSIITNLLSVYFATKNDIKTWLFGGLAAAYTAYLFIHENLFFSFIYQVITIILCIIGIKKWRTNQQSNEDLLSVKHTALYVLLMFLCFAFIIFFIPYGNTKLFIDIILTTLSLIATIMLLNHNIFAWIIFVILDICYIFIGVKLNNFYLVALYLVMFGLAFHGCLKNIRKYLKMNYIDDVLEFF
jgi:nicotinamide mononucleotide transporter